MPRVAEIDLTISSNSGNLNCYFEQKSVSAIDGGEGVCRLAQPKASDDLPKTAIAGRQYCIHLSSFALPLLCFVIGNLLICLRQSSFLCR